MDLRGVSEAKEKRFEQFLESGDIKIPVYSLVRTGILGGFLFSIISAGFFYYRGSLAYFGSFSLISCVYMMSVVFLLMSFYLVLGSFVSSILGWITFLSKKEVDFATFFAASAIGGILGRDMKGTILLEKHLEGESSKIGTAFLIGRMVLFGLTSLLVLAIFLP